MAPIILHGLRLFCFVYKSYHCTFPYETAPLCQGSCLDVLPLVSYGEEFEEEEQFTAPGHALIIL